MGFELYFNVDILNGVKLAISLGVDEQYCNMHFPAIAVIHLHHFIVVVDNIRHEHHPFSSKFLRINRLRRIRARPQSRIYQQVRRRSKVLYSVVGLMGFA
jgi:hypothetical protein